MGILVFLGLAIALVGVALMLWGFIARYLLGIKREDE